MNVYQLPMKFLRKSKNNTKICCQNAEKIKLDLKVATQTQKDLYNFAEPLDKKSKQCYNKHETYNKYVASTR